MVREDLTESLKVDNEEKSVVPLVTNVRQVITEKRV